VQEYGEASSQVIRCLHLEAAIYKHKREIEEMEKTFDEIYKLQNELYKTTLGTTDTTGAKAIAKSQHQAAIYFLGNFISIHLICVIS
jgi:hypothetical protein